LQYTFASSKTIRRYTVRAIDGNSGPPSPKDWTLEYHDGSVWQVADTVTGETGWTASEQRTFNIDTANTATQWRINITDNNGGVNVIIAEMEMMEVATWTNGADKLAQTFQLAAGEAVGVVTLQLQKVGSPAGTLTCRIETVDGSNNPTGTLVDANATATVLESTLSGTLGDVLFTFPASFTPGAGTYAVVLSTDRAADEFNYIEWGADGSTPSYANGEMKSEVSSVWGNEAKDAIFNVSAPGTVHPSFVSVDWWSSTNADMVNRYGDGNGANLDTQTTFKCLRAAGFDDVTVTGGS
jgi:hypothetical protein